MAQSEILPTNAVTAPGDWGMFKLKLMDEIDRPIAMKIATFFQFPVADQGQLNEQDRPGYLCVHMLECKGIITETNIDELLTALKRMTLHACEKRVRSHFSPNPNVCVTERQRELDRDQYRYVDDETYKSIVDKNKITVVNDVNRELFQNRIINFGLPVNINLQPSAEGGELRIALIGKTGQGKSSTANTILGLKLIEEDVTATSVTSATSRYRSIFRGREILVVDTPGLQDSHRDKEFVLQEITKVLQFLSDGVHAFIFVFNASCPRFTSSDKWALEELEGTFGRDIIPYSLAVFTRAEAVLNTMSLTDFLQKQMEDPIFGNFLERIGSKVTAVNNGSTVPAEKERNQEAIIALIDDMVQHRRDSGEKEVYTNELFAVAQKEIEERKMKLIQDGLSPFVYSAVEDAYSSSDEGEFLINNIRRRLTQTYYDELRDPDEEFVQLIAERLVDIADKFDLQLKAHEDTRRVIFQSINQRGRSLPSSCTLI